MKDELGREIMKEFVGLREKQHSYLKDQNDKGKSAIGTEKCVIKILKTVSKQLKLKMAQTI